MVNKMRLLEEELDQGETHFGSGILCWLLLPLEQQQLLQQHEQQLPEFCNGLIPDRCGRYGNQFDRFSSGDCPSPSLS